jgi:tRNA threonylcarbamoyladenosine biosynthesis protein TsaE
MGSRDHVASPTFTIGRQYHSPANDLTLYHFDFYRLQEPGLMTLELAEALADSAGVVVVEWAGVVEGVLPDARLAINITRTGENTRDFQFEYPETLAYLIPETD